MPGMAVPTRVFRDVVALATAARDFDEEGGGERLRDLVLSMPPESLHLAAVALARIVGMANTTEDLQRMGLLSTDDSEVIRI